MHWYDDRQAGSRRDRIANAKSLLSEKHGLPSEMILISAPPDLPDWARPPTDCAELPEEVTVFEDDRRLAAALGWQHLRDSSDGGITGIPAWSGSRHRRRFPDYRRDSGAALRHLVEPFALRFAVVWYPMYDERATVQWVLLFGYRGDRYQVTARPLGHAALELVRAIAGLHLHHGDPLPM